MRVLQKQTRRLQVLFFFFFPSISPSFSTGFVLFCFGVLRFLLTSVSFWFFVHYSLCFARFRQCRLYNFTMPIQLLLNSVLGLLLYQVLAFWFSRAFVLSFSLYFNLPHSWFWLHCFSSLLIYLFALNKP